MNRDLTFSRVGLLESSVFAEDFGQAGYFSSGGNPFNGKPVSEYPIYPLWDGPSYKGGSPISAPTSASQLGAPLGDLGSISFAPNGTVNGFIADDSGFDVYGITLNAGDTWTFSVYGSGATPLEDTVLYLFDTSGNFVTLDDDGGAGRMSLLSYTAAVSGNYFIAVSNFPGLGDLSGGYTLDVVQKPATDVVGDTFGGAELVGLGTTYGFIDGDGPNYLASFLGEIDTYALNVTAGKIYTIEIAGGADYASDFTALVDELDPVLVVWDSNGNFVGLNDDISFPNDINSGFSFLAQSSGTYYFDVMSYDPWTGGFSITISELDPSDFDPLESLGWDSASNIPVDANNVAYVYFADAGENFGELADDGVTPMTTYGWNAWEIQQVMSALDEYEKILGIDYQITTDVNQATFRLMTTVSTQYGAYFYPQDPAFGTQQGIGVFNIASGGWAFDQQQSLEKGGFAYGVILHEFGHAHGLAHPHDSGGGSEVMLGVAGSGSLGLYDLNQGVYTVMSYNDAWQTHPDGPTPFTAANVDSGWSGTLGAFDIAELQHRYGIQTAYATGDDVYYLGDANDPGVYYQTIWDAGGTDEIRYDGGRAARIDLLAATLDYTPTGGGVVSFVDDIWGGYTIANGVVIENATGGQGGDAILGNEADNFLNGRGGDDTLMGRAGADTLYGGQGNDVATYVGSSEGVKVSLMAGVGAFGDAEGDVLWNIEGLVGSQYDDTLFGSNKGNTIEGLGGDDRIVGAQQADLLAGGDGNDTVKGDNSNDTLYGDAGDDRLDGGNDRDVLFGGDGNDTLKGEYGGDWIDGGAGDDVYFGGTARDVFIFADLGGTDMIIDFKSGVDVIDVSQIDAVNGGAHDMFAWIGANAFSGTAGELRAYESGGQSFLEGDTDGDMVADFIVMTNVLIQSSDVYFG